jgi:hypothetical protein
VGSPLLDETRAILFTCMTLSTARLRKLSATQVRMPLKIEIGWQHDHVANRHAARPRQHEHHHVRHFASLQQTSRLLGFLQLLRRPVREQCADDGAR